MKFSRILSFLTFFLSGSAILAQVAWIDPKEAPVDREITIYFNAAAGNGQLKGYSGNMYLHTGVITNKSIDGHDWKYVVGDWGKADSRVLMKREEADLYSFRLTIRSFYKLSPEDVAQQLAFVFRNEEGTLVGKTTDNEDITIPVNGYKPPQKQAVQLRNPMRRILSVEKTDTSLDSLSRIAYTLGQGSLTPRTHGWNIRTDRGMVMIRPYTDKIVEVSFSPDGAAIQDSSHAVILKPGIVYRKETKLRNGFLLECGELQIFAWEKPYQLSFIFKGDTILREEDGFFNHPGNFGVRFRLDSNESIYGAGERAVPMNRVGYRFPLYNRPFYGYEMGATMLNYSMPLTFSSKKYAVLFDNPQKGYVDIGKTEPGIQEWGTQGGTLRYYLIAGENWPSLVNSYTMLTGRQSMPPRWALGNLQSRMAYRNQVETDSIVTLMQKKNFPVDAVILDFYWFGDSIQGHLGKLDWYNKAWPDPEGMIRKFRSKGVKTILITEPYVIDTVANHAIAAEKGVFVTDSLGRTYLDKQFYFGTGSLIDIFKPEARDWFWSKYQKQVEKGIAGWWGDLGEPESHPSDIRHVNGKADEVHNIYGHYWDRMLFEKYRKNYPETRLFHLQRSGFAGSQRYSAYPWTGDVSRSWGGFQAQLPLLLTMSMSGLGYIHSDAGGFAQGVKDDELYTRWLQFAVFSPILRPHGSVIPSEPVFWSEKTQDIVRRYMNLRYALLPYNYTLAWNNTSTGSPLMRPLFYGFPEDTTVKNIADQYLWGDAFMIAAVVQKGISFKSIYLPEGNWFDFHSGREYNGKQWIDYPLELENLPVFVKAGSFIPMAEAVSSTDYYSAAAYTILYYPSGTSEFVQYEDDGMDNNSLAEGNYELIYYKGRKEGLVTRINIHKEGKWKEMPTKRMINFKVLRTTSPSEVTINGKALSLKSRSIKKGKFSYKDGWLTISFEWTGKPMEVSIIENKAMK